MQRTPGVSRRGFLAAGAATMGAWTLAGCGSSNVAASAKSTGPTRLRVAAGEATESTGLDIREVGAGASNIVMYHLYDSLAYLTDTGYTLGLASSVTPNADATSWTIKLQDGVVFHNGAKLTSADVVFSLRMLASAQSNRFTDFTDVNMAGLSAPDAQTVVVPLKTARGDFTESILAVFSPIVPDNTTDFSAGIGSGPFKYAGQSEGTVKLVRNDSYWGAKPSISELDVVRIDDADTRLNALKSGQVDYAVSISAVGAQTAAADQGIQVRRGGAANSNALSFAMNTSLAPFNDPRVPQAVRLAADRNALIQNALLGFGTVGDDVVGRGLAGYDTSLAQRAQDTATAKSLFSAAGVTSLTLDTAEIVPGMTNAALLLVQQLQPAGVHLTLNQIPVANYYASLKALATRPFQAFYYTNRPIEVHLGAVTAPGAPFNVTGLGTTWWSQLTAAQAEPDATERAALFDKMQQYLYQSGGDLLWAFQEELDASRPGISGVQSVQSSPIFRTATVTA